MKRGIALSTMALILSFLLLNHIAFAASKTSSRKGGARKPMTQTEQQARPEVAPASGKVPWPGLDQAASAMRAAANLKPIKVAFDEPLIAPGMKGAPAADLEHYTLIESSVSFGALDPSTYRPGKLSTVDLPDQWRTPRDFHAGWYFANLQLRPQSGKRIIIQLDQVAAFAAVFMNGKPCGEHLGSYTPSEYDVTAAVEPGENLLAIYVYDQTGAVDSHGAYIQLGLAHTTDIGRMRGGLWSPIRIIQRNALHISDVFVKTSTRQKTLGIELEITNKQTQPQTASVDFQMVNWPDGTPAGISIPSLQVQIPAATKDAPARMTQSIQTTWENPRLWSPEQPNLYVLQTTIRTNNNSETVATRFGFREFWCEGKNFMLNGQPIRLRGESAWRAREDPHGGVIAYNRDIFNAYKALLGVNACRSHAIIPNHATFLAADEAGMLMIDQSSVWSAMGGAYNNAGELFMQNTEREFAEWVKRDRNSPSVAIWDVENEQLRGGPKFESWVMKLDNFVKALDTTRPIEHSGAGWYAPEQDIIHLHMQEHYTSILDFWRKNANKPLITGEFWVGGRGEKRLPSSKETESMAEYFVEEARLYEMQMLEMRYYGISGVMPFTIAETTFGRSFKYVPGQPTEFQERSPEVTAHLRHGLQPITAFFWPRTEAIERGKKTNYELVVCNDSETTQSLEVQWGLTGGELHKEKIFLGVAQQWKRPVQEEVTTQDQIAVRLMQEGQELSTDQIALRLINPGSLDAPQLKRKLLVYQTNAESVTAALQKMNIAAQSVAQIPSAEQAAQTILLIPPKGSDEALNAQSSAIRAYLNAGGRVLCLPQERWMKWSPIRLGFWSSQRDVPHEYVKMGMKPDNKDIYFARYAPIDAPGHPAFEGLSAEDLRWWNSYDGRVSDDALVRPSIVGDFAQGAWRVLATGSRKENISLGEARIGNGLLVFCQAHVIEEMQNAEAQLVFLNLLRYLDGDAWLARKDKVQLAGALTADQLAQSCGAERDNFAPAQAENGGLLIAGDGANAQEIVQWAERGGTALVLSAEVSGQLPGCQVCSGQAVAAKKAEANPLFWGVNTISFANTKQNPLLEGQFDAMPESAQVLLLGLHTTPPPSGWKVGDLYEKGKPAAIRIPTGKGEIIATTLAPWKQNTAQGRELMSLLLANAGVRIAAVDRAAATVRALKTVPIKIDGQLDDWTNDVEDRNVNPHRHAEPIVLSAQEAISGHPQGDAQFSAIAYLLWDEKNLYAAGALFGNPDEANVSMQMGGKTLNINHFGAGTTAAINQGIVQSAGAAFNTVADFVDAKLLSFTEIDKRVGHLKKNDHVNMHTWETAIPWQALGLTQPPKEMPLLIRIQGRDGVVLQSPVSAMPDNQQSWTKLVFSE